MSPLIKSGAQEPVPVRLLSRAREIPIPPDPRDVELAAVRAELEQMREQLRASAARHAADLETARRDGARAGRAEAERRDAERLDALCEGVQVAAADLARRLDTLDGLAAELTRAVIDKMFDDAEQMKELASAMLARRLTDLRREATLAVRVSVADFPGADTLEALVRRCNLHGIPVEHDPSFAAGKCRIDLRLGSVELDVPGQWRTLSALLDSMARGAS